MKKILLMLTLAFSVAGFSQAITVSTNTYTVPQLVNTVLINSPCVSAINVTSKTGTGFGSSNGIGFFQNTNPNFPMQSGVILSTGNVSNAVGPNTTALNDGAVSWPGDASLEATLAQSGIAMHSVNATVLEFDFTPISPTFSFDFLFASEEYGNFQCQFSDAFAFLLTNTSTGVTTNLAVVPNTTLPISVVTIRDFLYNSSCPSANSQYFGSYNGGSAAAASATNFNGQTKLMNASATLVPNTTYHIKLVIADRSDESSDSAIFISSDTFNIGQDVLGQDVTVSSPTAPCFGDTYVLNSSLSAADYTFSWTKDGQPVNGESGSTLNITQSGTYGITYQSIINGCQPVTDYVTIAYLPQIVTGTPTNLYKCDTGAASYTYNLAQNTPIIKAGMNPTTDVTYHATLAQANAGSNALPATYSSAPGQTIYVRVKNHDNNCFVVKTFQLLTSPAPIANQPPNLTKCASSSFNNSYFDLTVQNSAILNGQPAATYNITYYATLANATNAVSPMNSLYATNNTTIYARIQNVYDNTCFSTTSFVLFINPLPLVDVKENVAVCDPYALPHLTNGSYFSGPNGSGAPMHEGDIIEETKTIYIFNQPNGPTGCSAGSSFTVTILDPAILAPPSGSHCGSYTLPALLYGHYYTGEGGTGTQLAPGTVITTTQTVYVYFQSIVPPFCILTPGFEVVILPTVTLDNQENVFDCTSYTLPALTAGKYYTEPNAGGTELHAGDVITNTQTIYVYATSPNDCTAQKSFVVTIGIVIPEDVAQCEPFRLPILPIGNYYTGPHGSGQQLAGGTSVNLTQTIYIYVPNNGGTNCTDDIHFSVAIAQPIIDDLEDATVCDSYTLPVLANGEYFTSGNGAGTQLFAGDEITSSQTIYIFKRSTPICSNETSFNVTVSPKPAIDSRSDIDVCNSYVLTELALGNYFSGPNGTGNMLPAGTVITTSQIIYIYAVSPNAPFCSAENSFHLNIFSIEADAPANVTTCDRYTLPALTVGNYYANPNGPHAGEGNLMHAGDLITASKTIYVYTESGERINCTDENSFTVTINVTPIVAPVANVNACGSYTLPALLVGNYFTGAHGTGSQLHENDVITTNQTIYVYAETATTPNCSDEKNFTVNLFQVDKLQNVTICESYTLPALNIGNYYSGPNGTGTHLFAGQIINTSATLYIYAASPFSPTCHDESSFVLTIVDTPVTNPVAMSLTTVCDEDGINDGKTIFDLSQLNSTVLGSQTSAEFNVTYYASLADAVTETNGFVSTDRAIVFAKVTNTLTAHCFDVKPIVIKVNKLPEPSPVGGIICYESKTNTLLNPYTIQSGLSAATHTFQWFNDANELVGTASSYTAVKPGDYTVIATDVVTGCPSLATPVTVSPSEPAIISYSISDDFSDSMTITVEAQGVGGDYEYQLDNGPFQDSPTFQDVSSGNHIITVRDKNGCGMSTSKALVINYPKFFTPNGDGYNDTWNIVDLKGKDKAIIYIFDRYGKMLREIRPNGIGWDGSFAGQVMPSTDYWFSVTYEEDGIAKEFKSHFAMKR
jgi:gliding motility-associated-like protein